VFSIDDLLADLPSPTDTTPDDVRAVRTDARQLVVLDDDPTGTQSVADLPVLNAWSVDDLAWALGTGAAAVYVMTNSRSLDPASAAQRNTEVVDAALAAADRLGVQVDFVSRATRRSAATTPSSPT